MKRAGVGYRAVHYGDMGLKLKFSVEKSHYCILWCSRSLLNYLRESLCLYMHEESGDPAEMMEWHSQWRVSNCV
jgi:hypothetical protein